MGNIWRKFRNIEDPDKYLKPGVDRAWKMSDLTKSDYLNPKNHVRPTLYLVGVILLFYNLFVMAR